MGDVGSELRSKQKPDLVCSGRLFDQAGISFNSELRTFQESPGAEISIDEMFQIKAFTQMAAQCQRSRFGYHP